MLGLFVSRGASSPFRNVGRNPVQRRTPLPTSRRPDTGETLLSLTVPTQGIRKPRFFQHYPEAPQEELFYNTGWDEGQTGFPPIPSQFPNHQSMLASNQTFRRNPGFSQSLFLFEILDLELFSRRKRD